MDFVTFKDIGVEGRTYDENRKLITPGTIIASLDKTRYKLRVQEVEASPSIPWTVSRIIA